MLIKFRNFKTTTTVTKTTHVKYGIYTKLFDYFIYLIFRKYIVTVNIFD